MDDAEEELWNFKGCWKRGYANFWLVEGEVKKNLSLQGVWEEFLFQVEPSIIYIYTIKTDHYFNFIVYIYIKRVLNLEPPWGGVAICFYTCKGFFYI